MHRIRGLAGVVIMALLAGCASPEDGRARGGGAGGDGGNSQASHVLVPSKLDGTRP